MAQLMLGNIDEGVDAAVLNVLRPRIHQIYWKKRELNAMVLTESFG